MGAITSVYFESDLLERGRELAESRNLSFSSLINELLEQALIASTTTNPTNVSGDTVTGDPYARSTHLNK